MVRKLYLTGTAASVVLVDAERLLAEARRPLVLGIGGGGDVVGALGVAEHLRRYAGADPVLGGVSWERRPIDPDPGARSAAEIADAEPFAPGVLRCTARTHVAASGVRFAEARMAELLGADTVLIDPHVGPAAVAAGLQVAVGELGCDLIIFLDVGGDVLAEGAEPGLRSPLTDAMLLAAAEAVRVSGAVPVLLAVFGTGCDAELTVTEVLDRVAVIAASGGLLTARGLTPEIAARVAEAVEVIPTEASAMAVRAARGGTGPVTIRGGARTFELSLVAAITFFLDVEVAYRECGRLAAAVAATSSLEAANDALHELGVRTELDLERDAAAAS
jgi:hypothetical protein